MKFAAIIEYIPDASRVSEVRPAHRDYLGGLLETGNFVLGGPFIDDSGALIVYEAESADEVERFIENDPFAKRGVFASWKIRPWKLITANAKLLPI